jgi:hypothetical protein
MRVQDAINHTEATPAQRPGTLGGPDAADAYKAVTVKHASEMSPEERARRVRSRLDAKRPDQPGARASVMRQHRCATPGCDTVVAIDVKRCAASAAPRAM